MSPSLINIAYKILLERFDFFFLTTIRGDGALLVGREERVVLPSKSDASDAFVFVRKARLRTGIPVAW